MAEIDLAVGELLNECKKCNMMFDSREQLNNHLKKYCKESEYGDIEQLQKKLYEEHDTKYAADTNLNMNELKSYLRGERTLLKDEDLSNLTMKDLKSHFIGTEKAYAAMTKQEFEKQREEWEKEEDNRKKESQVVRLQARKDENQLLDLLKEVQQKKERELRSLAEKEQIKKALQELERERLSTLEQQKKNELLRLQAQREELAVKENEMVKDVDILRNKIIEQQKGLEAEKQRLIDGAMGSKIGEKEMDVIKKRQAELAKERGEKVAQYKLLEQQLEIQREKIMNEVNKLSIDHN